MTDSRAQQAQNAFRESVVLWTVKKDRRAAAEKLTLCLNLVPGVPEALYNRALIFAELGEDARAVEDLSTLVFQRSPLAKQLATLFDVHAQASVSIGCQKLASGDHDGAIELFTRAAVYAPENPVPYNNRGLALRSCGREAEAVVDLKKATALGWTGEHELFDTAERSQEEPG